MTSIKNFKYETYQTFNPKAMLIQKSNNLNPNNLKNEQSSFHTREGNVIKLKPKQSNDLFSFCH